MQGGALALTSSTRNGSTITDSVFFENQATYGGGIYFHTLTPQVPQFLNCTFLDNYASEFGGALFVDSVSTWLVSILDLVS